MSKKWILLGSLTLMLVFEAWAHAEPWQRRGRFWGRRAVRARAAVVQRPVNSNYYARPRGQSNSYRSSSSQPWYINSEPAFRSPRVRTLVTFSGYPYAFDH